MGKLEITPDSAQHIGERGEQQDAYGCFDYAANAVTHAGYLAVVADGMGGMVLGKEAAVVAVSAFIDAYGKKAGKAIPDALRQAAFEANAAVLGMAGERGVRGETGTTLIAAVIRDDELYWISVGDSRIYLLDRQSIAQLNEEHNLKSRLERLAARGLVDAEEALTHPQREALLSYIGIEDLTEMDIPRTPVKLARGCCVLLCSDGLYRALPDEEILSAAWRSAPREMARELVAAAIGKGKRHQDNVTAITLTLDGGCDQAADIPGEARIGGYRGITLRLSAPK
ncbi:MAG: protein phosphatase 2C domain-containing protein [Synergistaceae bacterium]|jgi:protein phosphatase|nr:protein phosphatase 2C domain-containing protein [Synergistaceae bacterium]